MPAVLSLNLRQYAYGTLTSWIPRIYTNIAVIGCYCELPLLRFKTPMEHLLAYSSNSAPVIIYNGIRFELPFPIFTQSTILMAGALPMERQTVAPRTDHLRMIASPIACITTPHSNSMDFSSQTEMLFLEIKLVHCCRRRCQNIKVAMCRLRLEARSQAKLGPTFGLRRLLARPGFEKAKAVGLGGGFVLKNCRRYEGK